MNPTANDNSEENDKNTAADMVRQKIENIYKQEPDAVAEEREVVATDNLSKHQKFMRQLVDSGEATNRSKMIGTSIILV